MDVIPSEEIVTAWLNEMGFFTINNHKVGASELDILAVNPVTNEKAHIEVSVSVRPIGALGKRGKLAERRKTRKELPDRIKVLVEKKFMGRNNRVANEAKRMLGGEYERWIVLGLLDVKYDPTDEVIKELEKHDVNTVLFKDVVSELINSVEKRSYPNTAKRYTQLFKYLAPQSPS